MVLDGVVEGAGGVEGGKARGHDEWFGDWHDSMVAVAWSNESVGEGKRCGDDENLLRESRRKTDL